MKMDIKECAKFDFCGFGGTCTETESLFMCTCPEGYTVGSDGKCKDENECSFGMVGYNKCLLRSQLGSCKNTVGSYMCECLEGSYTNANLVGKECMACNCNEHGLQSCDGTTGACLCRANVAGADCGVCKTGHTGYPFCEYCEPGYYKDGSNCVKCSCEETGVTDSICSSRSGQCTCKENMAGSRCDHCKAHYINFPACTPDVKDGTLTPWGAWSSWSAGECGQSEKSKLGSGYTQTRTRKRRCDNDTKNIHGRSCTGDITLETESRWHNVCRDVRRLWITIPDVTDAGTTAYLWMKIRQAGVTSKYIQCETWALWDDPDNDDLDDDIVYGPNGCNIAFDITKPLEISLQSDSSNDVYVNKIGVTIGNIRKGYYSYPKKYEVLDEDTNNIYFTTSNDKDTDITKEKCYGC
ncbi:laminin subunit alpha-like [Bolinopsis microptera]|uniref:laminin subunit alpha-like n=1 Tax=Bolinopsis microptera TaxID=2820187 RepID=UPI00307A9B63